jgi:hypothetical protein
LGALSIGLAALTLDGPGTAWRLTASIEPWVCLAAASVLLGAGAVRMLMHDYQKES